MISILKFIMTITTKNSASLKRVVTNKLFVTFSNNVPLSEEKFSDHTTLQFSSYFKNNSEKDSNSEICKCKLSFFFFGSIS